MSNSKTNPIAGVVGFPISHSLSPRLHGFWLKKYNISGEYRAFEVRPEDLQDFVKSLDDQNIVGVNLTVPHKEIIFPFLDHIDDIARKIGAVNMLSVKDGKLFGTNTDGYGFMTNLQQAAPDWKAEDGPVVIIGAGGAARAAIVSFLEKDVPEIRLINRTQQRAEDLAHEFKSQYLKSQITVVDWSDRSSCLSGAGIVVNTTTLGMKNQPPLDIDLTALPQDSIVYDIVYNPLETDLLKQARQRGNLCVDGLGMLLYQAAPAFQAWFGHTPEVDQTLRDYVLTGLKP